jgi:hypothetical protein
LRIAEECIAVDLTALSYLSVCTACEVREEGVGPNDGRGCTVGLKLLYENLKARESRRFGSVVDKSIKLVRFQVLTAMYMITIFRDVAHYTNYSPVEIDKLFRDAYCLHTRPHREDSKHI